MVSDEVSGQPISGVQVSLKVVPDGTWEDTASDENGRFCFRALSPAEYAVKVSCPQMYTVVTSNGAVNSLVSGVTIERDEVFDELDFRLRPCTHIAGRVSDEGGNPIGGAALTGRMPGSKFSPVLETTTDDDGSFSLEGAAPECNYFISVVANGYHAASAKVKPPQKGLDDLDFVLGPSAVVSGVVVDSLSRPLPGAVVKIKPVVTHTKAVEGGEVASAMPQEAEAREGGFFEIRSVGPGAYEVLVCRPHTTHWQKPLTDILQVSKGAVLTGLRVIMPPSEEQFIEGTVRDAGGRALPGIKVVAHSRGEATTDAAGRYHIDGLGEEPVLLMIASPGFPEVKVYDVPVGTTDADFALAKPGAISGRVIDAPTGNPVDEFTIEVKRFLPYDDLDWLWVIPRGTFEHQEAGAFTIRDIYPGDATLLVESKGRAPELVRVVVTEGQTTSGIIIRLGKPCVLEGRLTVNGTPLGKADASVTVVRSDDIKINGRVGVDDSGIYRIDEIPPGTYVVTACRGRNSNCRYFRTVEVQLGIGRTVRADFEMGGTTCIKGVVNVPEGYVNARVYVQPADAVKPLPLDGVLGVLSDLVAVAGLDGSDNAFLFDGVLPGTYKVTADCRSLSDSAQLNDVRQTSREVTIADGEVIEVNLAP